MKRKFQIIRSSKESFAQKMDKQRAENKIDPAEDLGKEYSKNPFKYVRKKKTNMFLRQRELVSKNDFFNKKGEVFRYAVLFLLIVDDF